MKKLLGVTVLLALVCALVPVHAFAALRGVWDPLTNTSAYQTGLANGCEQPSLRNANVGSNGGHAQVERWFAFSTRSTVVGSETVRSIWIGRNAAQIGASVANILDARRPLLLDPAAMVSYTDPAWSPNGKYLAYVETDGAVTQSAIWVQEYATGTSLTSSPVNAATPIGSPLLIIPAVPGVVNRSPDWKPDGTALCYASNAAGPSTDIWYVDVDVPTATVGVPARATTNDTRSEINPTWGPGNQIAYATNKFGRNVLEIVDLDNPGFFFLAETNFASISHNNPSWSSDGSKIYYDAAQNEDINNNTDIFVLTLATQSKCDIFFDNRGDADPDVSSRTNLNLDGVPYNLFLCSSQGANFGLNVWRASANNCLPAIALGVSFNPTTLNLSGNNPRLDATITMPPESYAAGFRPLVDVDDIGNVGIPAGTEGIKNRNSIIVSPTFLGRAAPTSEVNGAPFAACQNNDLGGGEYSMTMKLSARTVSARLIALGLVDQNVICPVTAYSNVRGRQMQGYGYLHLSSNSLSGQLVRLEQNSPNPFNPVTKIRFAVAKPGFVNVRVYNVRGELVKTVASGNFGTGSHDVSWDGSTNTGNKAASGVYFAKASVGDGKGGEVTSDVVKMVMAK